MQQNNSLKQGQQQIQTGGIDFKEIFFQSLSHWRWFVLSLIVAFLGAVYYMLSTHPLYSSYASVLMADNSSSLASNADLGMDISMFAGSRNKNNNVYNDIEMFCSPDLMKKVVKELDLQMNYVSDGMFRDKICYGATLPAEVKFLDLDDNEALSFNFDVYKDSTFTIRDLAYAGNLLDVDMISGHFGDTLFSVVGRLTVVPSEFYNISRKMVYDYFKESNSEKIESKLFSLFSGKVSDNLPVEESVSNGSALLKTMRVRRVPLVALAGSYSGRLSVELSGKQSTTLILKFVDVSPDRTRDVLSMLIAVYNGQWLLSRNQISKSTSSFIDERLSIIQKELGNVDQEISSFKSETMIPDLKQASSMYMSKSEDINSQLLELNNELYVARHIMSYFTSDSRKNELLPVNSGIKNFNIAEPIRSYNEQLLRRNALVAKSSAENPLVQTYDMELVEMRKSIVSSIEQEIVAINSRIDDLKGSATQTTETIKSSPTQAKFLLSIERQQKVKESLYLYLLQKREENELSQAFTAYNTQIITPPTSSVKVGPIAFKILCIAIALGFVIPVCIIVIINMMNTTVRGKEDLASLTIPIIGEIPFYFKNKSDYRTPVPVRIKRILVSLGIIKKKKQKDDKVEELLVTKTSRDVLNEAFRVLRTNVEFVSSKKSSSVILVTSFTPGEGKSFASVNLAASLAIRGEKVLVIDCDLRHASASKYIQKTKDGLSSLLAYKTTDYANLIVQHPDFESLYILPVGSIPPNPSELLADIRFEQLIDKLRNEYKYVILDCPPVGLVADTQIVNKVVDRTLFIVRIGLLDKAYIQELQKMYNEATLNNISIILNGVYAAGKYGNYGYRYGYRYGYKYGYRYGYYGSEESKS